MPSVGHDWRGAADGTGVGDGLRAVCCSSRSSANGSLLAGVYGISEDGSEAGSSTSLRLKTTRCIAVQNSYKNGLGGTCMAGE